MTLPVPPNSSSYFNSFDQTGVERDQGLTFAQVCFVSTDVDNVIFDSCHDPRLEMSVEIGVPYQTAGQMFRRSYHPVSAVILRDGGRRYAKARWSRRTTASGHTRWHEVLVGGSIVATYVQLEGEEITELWRRLNAAERYDDRSGIMREFAREVCSSKGVQVTA